jgi:dolichyl-phosphate beta-glucosyltransferase
MNGIIVIPCYNEADRLDIERFKDYAALPDGQQLLFVDDGSSDDTLMILESMVEAVSDRYSILSLPKNQGKAEAVRQGINRALQDNPDFVGFWDADLATPLDAISEFCNILAYRARVRIVIGSRMPLLGHDLQRAWIRWLLGRCFVRVASQLLRVRFYDTQCGAKLFRNTPEVRRVFAEPFLARWIFDVEIFARLFSGRSDRRAYACDTVFEFPLAEWKDVAGSHMKARDFATAVRELARIYFRYLRPGARGYRALNDVPSAVPHLDAAIAAQLSPIQTFEREAGDE